VANWIKLSTGISDDEKMKIIDSMPERDTFFYIWIRLLVLAGKINDNGLIYISESMPYDEKTLSAVFNRPEEIIKKSLDLFEQMGMIEISNSKKVCLVNWEKHQNIDGLDKLKELNKERVKKHREKQRNLMNKDYSNITVTLPKHYSNGDVMDKNKNKIKNKKDFVLEKLGIRKEVDEVALNFIQRYNDIVSGTEAIPFKDSPSEQLQISIAKILSKGEDFTDRLFNNLKQADFYLKENKERNFFLNIFCFCKEDFAEKMANGHYLNTKKESGGVTSEVKKKVNKFGFTDEEMFNMSEDHPLYAEIQAEIKKEFKRWL